MSGLELLPENNAQYGTQAYWDERYSKEPEEATFDWFQTIDLVPLVQRFVPNQRAKICMLGCGNSTLSADLYDVGYHHIVNLDYSSVLIERMRRIHSVTRPEMTWQTGDVRFLPFADDTFDVCIDKGTMDAMMTSIKDPWNPPESVVIDCRAEIDEVVRVLSKPAGVFLYLTWGQPHFRKQYLIPREGWELEVVELGDGFCYYLYVLRRTDRPRKEEMK